MKNYTLAAFLLLYAVFELLPNIIIPHWVLGVTAAGTALTLLLEKKS